MTAEIVTATAGGGMPGVLLAGLAFIVWVAVGSTDGSGSSPLEDALAATWVSCCTVWGLCTVLWLMYILVLNGGGRCWR